MSYAHHITDPEGVLPFNRNNCRGGDEENCMYYNSNDGAHFNYTAVQGTGDPQSPYASCSNMAMNTFNDKQVYGDAAIGGLGGYENSDPYGEINEQKGFYGQMEASYPAKPTCQGYVNTNAVADDGQDYQKWDRYHKYHPNHKVLNAHLPDPSGNGMLSMLPMNTTTSTLMMLGVLALLYSYRNRIGNVNMTMLIAAVAIFFFFNRR